jgi:Copper type II ascorbate-dependent monooxygenase, C-terminal domain
LRSSARPPRTPARAAAAVAVVLLALVAACGSGSAGTAQPDTAAAASGHGGHDTTAAVPPAQPLRPGERFLELSVSKPYTPSPPNGGTDDYRCLVVDPQLTAPAFLTGTQFQPQNVPIAHHAIVFAIPPEQAADARAKDAASGGQGWTCFGDTGLESEQQRAAWVDSWTPGGTETLLQHDVGFRLEPGSLLILQIHYNLLATQGRPDGTDRSTVRLRLTDGTPATERLDTLQLSAPIELPCAEGETGPLCDRATAVADVAQRFGTEVGDVQRQLLDMCSGGTPVPGDTQHCDTAVPQPITVYAAFGHMHLLGRAISVELNPGTDRARTLLDVPVFDFDDQKLQPLPTPVDLEPGDTLRVTCTHDAGLRGMLPELSTLPPRYVVWGDGTSDEMCLGLLTATVRG